VTVADPEPHAHPPTTWIDALLTIVRDREITRNTASLLVPILITVLLAVLVLGGVVAAAVMQIGVGPTLTAAGVATGLGSGGLIVRRGVLWWRRSRS
jgi:hypothetical protein